MRYERRRGRRSHWRLSCWAARIGGSLLCGFRKESVKLLRVPVRGDQDEESGVSPVCGIEGVLRRLVQGGIVMRWDD